MIERVESVAYGRPASEALAATVARAKAVGALAPVTVVVPSNLAGLTARRLLGGGLAGTDGIANVALVTPFRLAELLGNERLLDSRPLTNPVLGAAVRLALADDPGPFAPVADHHATQAALASLYAELSNASPDALERVESQGGAAARDAVRTYRLVASKLHGFHDEADVARAARERPDLDDALAALGHLVWYLPAPMTQPLTELVGTVLRRASASSVIVGLTGDDAADAAVRSVCARAGVEIPPDVSVAVPTASEIVSVTDADEEVRAVVRHIVALAEAGVALDRIGVFHPTPDPYVGILQEQLQAAGIPCNGPSRRRLADTVAGRALLGALALPAHRWRRDKVMALASGGPLRVDGERVHPSTWERISRRAGVVQGMGDWHRKLSSRRTALESRLHELEADPEAEDAWLERLRRELADVDELDRFVTELARAVHDVERASGWQAKSRAASELLVQLLGGEHLHTSWPEPEQVAFERVQDVLARLAALDELEPDPTHDVFVHALKGELDETAGRLGRFGTGVVHGPLASAPGHDLDAVFVLGCTEGLCPAPRRDDALLPDQARALAYGELQLRAARLEDQHRAFLAALAAAPAGARVLTYARGDLRGNRRTLPSRWLLDSASALAGRRVHATDFSQLDAPAVQVVPSFAAGVTAAAVHGSLPERDLAAAARFVEAGGSVAAHPVAELVHRGFEVQAARRSPAFTPWDGNLAGQPVDVGIDRPFSPTRLETWAYCGFRYFLKHVLGLADRDDPERVVDLSPIDRGSGVHRVLEQFFAEAIARGAPDPDEQWSDADHERLRQIAEEVFAGQEAQGRTGRALRWQLTRSDLLEMLDEFLLYDDDYRAASRARPERVELPFGMDGNDPVTLTLPDGRDVSFRGFADRVDRAGDDHVLVIDYKTGKGADYVGIDEGDPVREGTMLQLGLYAEAAHQLLDAATTEAHYWMVDPRAHYERRGYRWTTDRRERFIDVLGTIVEGIEAGVFLVDPGEWNIWRGTHERCTYCDFDRLCVRDRGEQAEAKVAAPELRRRDALSWTEEDEA